MHKMKLCSSLKLHKALLAMELYAATHLQETGFTGKYFLELINITTDLFPLTHDIKTYVKSTPFTFQVLTILSYFRK